jgi:hypothetical protein
MSIDERLDKIATDLDKLAERHIALTESVELLLREGQTLLQLAQNHERRIQRLEGKG